MSRSISPLHQCIALALILQSQTATSFMMPRAAFRVRAMSAPPFASTRTSTFLRSNMLEDPPPAFKKEKQKNSNGNASTTDLSHQETSNDNMPDLSPFGWEVRDEDEQLMMPSPTLPDDSEEMAVQKKDDGDDNKLVEFLGLGTWIAGLSTFLLVNNFVGPFPGEWLQNTPVEYFGLTHAIAGMLFGGGVILTTLIEWLAVSSKNASVLNFWFGKVPALDSMVVLPALTASIVSGVGLSVDHYNTLGEAPVHVVSAISTLLAFAIWWASTDLTTQGAATEAVEKWTQDGGKGDIPRIVQLRKISNVVSCTFVAAIYAIMVLKPGYSP